jgi:hypothetical protein
MKKAKRRRHAAPILGTRIDVPVQLLEQLVDMANANNERMDGTTRPVLEIVAANDLVFGIWDDPKEQHGVGWLIVKGVNHLRTIIATGAEEPCKMTAIACVAYEQAAALREMLNADPVH